MIKQARKNDDKAGLGVSWLQAIASHPYGNLFFKRSIILGGKNERQCSALASLDWSTTILENGK